MKIDDRTTGKGKLCIMIYILLSIFHVNAIEVNVPDNVTNLNLSNLSFSSISAGFQIENNNSISNNTNEIEATTSDSQQVFGIAPSQVLSPVIGNLEQIGTTGSCSGTKWCFNQHQTGGHIPNGGICHADDTYAWDANLNTPTYDYDNGKPVYAAAAGTVAQTYGGCTNADGTPNSFGQVLIEHTYLGSTWRSGYGVNPSEWTMS